MDILQSLGVNNTFFIQIINFLILVVILYFLLYKPLFKTINERQEKIAKGLELNQKMELELEKIDKRQKEVLSEAQAKSNEIIENAKKSAAIEVEKIIESTNRKSEVIIKEYEKKLENDRQKLEQEMEEKVYSSVKLILKKVLNDNTELDKKYISNIIEQNGK